MDRRDNPTLNILIVGLLALAGSLALSLEQAGELINFGAFLAFMGVNLAALRQWAVRLEGVDRVLAQSNQNYHFCRRGRWMPDMDAQYFPRQLEQYYCSSGFVPCWSHTGGTAVFCGNIDPLSDEF